MSISHSQILFKLRSNICARAWMNAFHLQLWLAFTHRNHFEVQNCMLTRKSQCMRLSQTSALSRIKCCTTVEAMAHLWAGTDGNTALREVKYWHGRKDQGREKQTTSKSECEPVAQSMLIVRDVKSTAGSWQPDRADGDEIFSSLKDISDNYRTLWIISSL